MAEADMKDKVYLFRVNMKLGRGFGPVWGEMELKGSSSLHEFAKAITGAFNFNLDHLYGFYDDLKDRYESIEKYNTKTSKTSFIHAVFQAGKKMLFLFDFGDEWDFIVECKRITEVVAGKEYPVVTKSKGEGPSQYPSDPECYSDEEEEEEVDAEEMGLKAAAEEKRMNIVKEYFSSSTTELEK